jgi:pimeloyl-ACP methyl ester carboxylesterase
MKDAIYGGVNAAVLTAMKPDLSPDLDRMAAHAKWLLANGCTGLGVLGTTGEANSFGLHERKAILEGLIARGIPAARMMPGTGCASLMDSVELTKHARDAGCPGVLMLPPYYYKAPTEEGLFAWYAQVIERTKGRAKVFLYHFPQQSAVPITLSLIRRLLEQGLDVYLIDWGYPDGADRFLDLVDYINGFLDRCVQFVLDQHGIDKVNLLGVCQGGTFSLCYSALHPERIKNLVAMVTPVDFKTPENLLSKWAQDMDVDAVVDSGGNVSGEMLNVAYVSLMPFRLMQQKYVSLVDILGEPKQVENFMRMEKWIFDSPDQAGDAFRQFFADDVFQQVCLFMHLIPAKAQRL